MSEDQERAFIEDVKTSIRKWSGQELAGWLAPALTLTERTMDLLAQAGITYTLDLFHDDQPMPVNVSRGRLISIPYSLEINDFTTLFQGNCTPRDYTDAIKAQFDRLYMEGGENGQVMCLPLHPFVIEHQMSQKEVVREGLYVFAADALGPHCESVTLSFYSEARPDKADVLTVDRPIVERIWQDFAPYRAEGKQDAAQ